MSWDVIQVVLILLERVKRVVLNEQSIMIDVGGIYDENKIGIV